MNINQLRDELSKLQIPKNAYQLKGGLPNEVFCIGMENNTWEVYYSERGNKTNKKIFSNEELACGYFLNWMRTIFKK
ncbi:MAG: hypothetical protein MJA82_13790 [Clostridia bacterium]|nr:hypothetical protein [Clostridia bacterium]